ncbi:hypothetical protein ACFOGJ_11780 [Marinibaculum pumilum]|uniref:Uncharacterized protein n=1 Tax=Marinibaculum pumilum TaxID=1766165 RepID=A0ABV7L0N6_9PROT
MSEPEPQTRPEQTFFTDPALDRVMGVVMALATEVWVMKDRQAALERALAARGLDLADLLDAEPGDADRRAMAAEREAFVAHLMDNMLGRQVSLGAS